MSEKQERIYITTIDLRSIRVARDVLRDISGVSDEADHQKLMTVKRLLAEIDESEAKKLNNLIG